MWFEQLASSKQLSFQIGTFAGITGKAVFDINGTRRYFLEKRWAQGGDILTAVMMNPSNAAHNQTDETVEQLIDVAKVQCCNALYVVNISSFIDGSSSNLNNAKFTYEDINWAFVSGAISEANIVFLGWGMKGQLGMLKQQKSNSNVVNAFKERRIFCYEVLKSNDKRYAKRPVYYVPHPRPLYDKKKYSYVPIREINEHEVKQIFIR
ncbi:DUF1643 domain-containing protein [Paenibacillus sp. FSL R10-2734]|uniref:DUF1643 domain-containing protein n=1 Tax=Paenibacillus sp. FSL R10-2734 TaxID=2954691 RepID=UPI0030DCF2FA